jgi:hypothetical protein
VTSDFDPTQFPSEQDPVVALLQELPEEEGHRASERVATISVAAALLGLSVVYLVQAFSYEFGNLERPGPALFPVIIGVGLLAVSLGLLVEGARVPRERFLVWPYASGAIRLGVAIIACALYIILMPMLGQLICGALLSAGLLWAMRLTRWWLLLLLSVVFSVSVDYLFGTVLGVQLPAGLFRL